MTTAEAMQHEILDINVIPDHYTTYIIDIWEGSRHDPATTIVRYIGVWRAEDLEDAEGNAIDPDWSTFDGRSYYSASRLKPHPLKWESLETIKEGDHDARMFRSQQSNLLDEDRHRYGGSERTRDQMYQEFMTAIDTLVDSPDDDAAWAAVGKWRAYQAHTLEK